MILEIVGATPNNADRILMGYFTLDGRVIHHCVQRWTGDQAVGCLWRD
jgi:hypothetical protein